MVKQVRYSLITLHGLNAVIIAVYMYTASRFALIEKEVRENEPIWKEIRDLTLAPMFGLWAALVFLALFVAIRKVFPGKESLRCLMHAVLGPPLYYLIIGVSLAKMIDYL